MKPPPMQVEAQARELAVTKARLQLRAVIRGDISEGEQQLTFHTDSGDIAGLYHPARPLSGNPTCAVVWVGGSRGGFDGPARGLYPAACSLLKNTGIAGLRIHYRRPNDLSACVLDTLLAVDFLHAEGMERVALVGHSFGGAVVIKAGAASSVVTAVVAISTQAYGANRVAQLAPRPLLLIHGTDDEVLSSRASKLVYDAARQPKELKLFSGAGHDLDSVRAELLELLATWLEKNI